jgi:GDPmannose 4,6-dehydratase
VRDFVVAAAQDLGMTLEWCGKGVEEHAVVNSASADCAATPGQKIVAIDPRYHRPAEVETLLGDASHAREQLGWRPRTDFASLVAEMVRSDLALARRDALVKKAGFRAQSPQE